MRSGFTFAHLHPRRNTFFYSGKSYCWRGNASVAFAYPTYLYAHQHISDSQANAVLEAIKRRKAQKSEENK